MSSSNEKDPYDGVGGSYVLDPKTGKRQRVESPAPPAESAPAAKPDKTQPAPRRSTETPE